LEYTLFDENKLSQIGYWPPEAVDAYLADRAFTGNRAKDDDYALGCILHNIIYGKMPQGFFQEDPIGLLNAKQRYLHHAEVAREALETGNLDDDDILALMKSIACLLMHPDPNLRLSAEQALDTLKNF
jgi:hypothetical protein